MDGEHCMSEGWIGVDLDGTLAEYHGWANGKIGLPIMPMVERVRAWLKEGREVRIFTARASTLDWSQAEYHSQMAAIREWCLLHIGTALPVTCQKDYHMEVLWDDRVVQVMPNTGQPVSAAYRRP